MDFSRLLPGPFSAYLLGSLGARVTVVDPPDRPEVLSFPVLRKGKKRIFIDLKSEEGRRKVLQKVKDVDVVIEGFRPGVMARLKMGFKELRKINPRVIFCSLSGYGQKEKDRAGHDLNYLSESGFLKALFPVGLPQVPGIPLADLIGGMTAALRILAYLARPTKQRKAVHLDISITEAVQTFLIPLDAGVREIIRPIFSGGLARYQIYETKEGGPLAVAPLEEKFWRKLAAAMAIPPAVLQTGERETVAWLREEFKKKSCEEWLRRLSDPDLCVTPVL